MIHLGGNNTKICLALRARRSKQCLAVLFKWTASAVGHSEINAVYFIPGRSNQCLALLFKWTVSVVGRSQINYFIPKITTQVEFCAEIALSDIRSTIHVSPPTCPLWQWLPHILRFAVDCFMTMLEWDKREMASWSHVCYQSIRIIQTTTPGWTPLVVDSPL